ncbi:MAG: MBL fold metallo-hydrolase [Spirochaetes bacterium]|jgi:hydroxyacylglutathione hydrolase|nr:MBL fold metallo-hydrolase [Spirochaetota bacterium]
MYFKHVYEDGLAQASYVVGCQATGSAIVIDPRRDIQVYLEIADSEGFSIDYITETHIHADFLSGTRELAAATGAKVLLSGEGGADWQYDFDHESLTDGDSFTVGNLRFDVIHTPGHTPEHICFVLTDLPSSEEPVMLFTGDFLFVGDVGRPDLLEEAAGVKGAREVGAHQMYESVHKLDYLPDFVQVWPGHGAGSACGKALGAVPSTTLGYERRVNWAYRTTDETEFVAELLDGQPEPPTYFGTMKIWNREGPKVLQSLPRPNRLDPSSLKRMVDRGAQVVDARDKFAYAGGHLPGSYNIPDSSDFSTWAGWLLDFERDVVLIAPDHRVDDLVARLVRIGCDRVVGYLPDIERLSDTGIELEIVRQRTVADVHDDIASGAVSVLDVRSASEYGDGHIEDALNIHAGRLPDHLAEIPRDREVVVHCETGFRSSIASSVLLAHGVRNVSNMTGGYAAWQDAGYETVAEGEPVG